MECAAGLPATSAELCPPHRGDSAGGGAFRGRAYTNTVAPSTSPAGPENSKRSFCAPLWRLTFCSSHDEAPVDPHDKRSRLTAKPGSMDFSTCTWTLEAYRRLTGLHVARMTWCNSSSSTAGKPTSKQSCASYDKPWSLISCQRSSGNAARRQSKGAVGGAPSGTAPTERSGARALAGNKVSTNGFVAKISDDVTFITKCWSDSTRNST
mmetsp:Transcript_125751/g.363786  ORF Transcript_125751/g.363786 Transcript_125751/m.363786 type:complete len:209 (+) Transcript_125751:294-920(+)